MRDVIYDQLLFEDLLVDDFGQFSCDELFELRCDVESRHVFGGVVDLIATQRTSRLFGYRRRRTVA